MMDMWNTSAEIKLAQPEIAVFGIGAVEQHSIHLPLGTDWLWVCAVTERVARELNAYLVPALPFSMSQCHGPMAGTVWLKPNTLASVVHDVVLSLHDQGYRKVLIVNGHGGNFVLEAVIRELNLSYPDLIVVMPPDFVPGPDDTRILDNGVGIHAGEVETSTQLSLNPEHVKEERIDYLPPVGREFLDYAFMEDISEQGVWGYPSLGTASKGQRLIDYQVTRIVEWTRETCAEVESLRAN
jgi:creatinine amidohydrolase